MDTLFTIIGIVIASRVLSFPICAFLPVIGSVLFLAMVFAGLWLILSPSAAVIGLACLLSILWALGQADAISS
ncbi:MAG: hypothetical protein RBT11_19085 [Desulfobacterales bacterium]|nr:hypothetical protein [Desulfobacterales bacterium]